MAVEDKNYKLEILEYAVNQSINRLLPKSSEDALSIILYQSNEVVWRVATDIYTKSGHQIDFLFIRDILNLRIEPLRNQIAKIAKIKAELQAERLAKEAEEAKIRKQKEEEKQKEIEEFNLACPNSSINTFVKIRSIIAEKLEVSEESITLNANLDSDLYADESDLIELLWALEEEFDLEIPDDFTELSDVSVCFPGCHAQKLKPVSIKEIVNLVSEKIQ